MNNNTKIAGKRGGNV